MQGRAVFPRDVTRRGSSPNIETRNPRNYFAGFLMRLKPFAEIGLGQIGKTKSIDLVKWLYHFANTGV